MLRFYLRPLKFGWKRWRAQRCAAGAGPADLAVPLPPLAFVVGCGRSGTSILGKILQRHPQVCYLFEPYHLWAAIDERCDAINFYHRVDPWMLMDAGHATTLMRQRFHRLMRLAWQPTGAALLMEKTPYNAMRVGYLDALAPTSRFIHIVRDGADVARSIARLAVGNTYRIAGRPNLNQWWGTDHSKWKALARDGAAAGYFADEVAALADDDEIARGAYEWLVSLAEIDRWRSRLGARLHEISYPALTREPKPTLRAACRFLSVEAPAAWLDQASAMLEAPRPSDGPPIALPPRMAEAFNRYQQRYGFSHRAVAASPRR